MERIVLVGNIYNFNGNLTFVLQLAGFEVFQVSNVEEAINLNEIYACLEGGFHMLVIKNSDFVNMWTSYSGLLRKLMKKTKVLRVANSAVTKQDNAALGYVCPVGEMSICNATDITAEIKRIFGRS